MSRGRALSAVDPHGLQRQVHDAHVQGVGLLYPARLGASWASGRVTEGIICSLSPILDYQTSASSGSVFPILIEIKVSARSMERWFSHLISTLLGEFGAFRQAEAVNLHFAHTT